MLGRKDATPTALASTRAPGPGADMRQPVLLSVSWRAAPSIASHSTSTRLECLEVTTTGRALGCQPGRTGRNEIANRCIRSRSRYPKAGGVAAHAAAVGHLCSENAGRVREEGAAGVSRPTGEARKGPPRTPRNEEGEHEVPEATVHQVRRRSGR